MMCITCGRESQPEIEVRVFVIDGVETIWQRKTLRCITCGREKTVFLRGRVTVTSPKSTVVEWDELTPDEANEMLEHWVQEYAR